MRSSIFVAAVLGAVSTMAAPTWPKISPDAIDVGGIERLSEYFNILANKIRDNNGLIVAPSCDLSQAKMPESSLEPPSDGLVLKHVAVGRGTQNYTCDLSNSTAVPVANGAVATLFNSSCVAASYPDLLHVLPGLALQFDLPSPGTAEPESVRLGPTNLAVSGLHYFTDSTTPFFNLDTTTHTLGQGTFSKKAATDAPSSAPSGRVGEKAVAWLKLVAKGQGSGNIQEVYRLETAGGSPPATCQGQEASFQVEYATEYWFWEGPAPAST